MYVCMYICMCIYIYIYTYTYIYFDRAPREEARRDGDVEGRGAAGAGRDHNMSIYRSIYLSIYISLSLIICMYVCMYIYIYHVYICV